MNWGAVLQFVATIGPGFVLLKVLYVFGGQHRRLEWEWLVWSVLFGIVLTAISTAIVSVASFPGGPIPQDAAVVVTSFALAVASGAVLAVLWYRVKGSKRQTARVLVRYVSDSAWDFILDTVNRQDNGVEVTTEVDGKEVAYYGSLDTFGQEVAQAEPWLYLTFVYRWEEGKGYVPLSAKTVGMLFHRSEIKRLRFIARGEPAMTTEPVLTGTMSGLAVALIARPQDEPESPADLAVTS